MRKLNRKHHDKPHKIARRAALRVKLYNGVINGAILPARKRRKGV